MKNEILLEVWRNRDKFARRCNYDLEVMLQTLRQVERAPWNPLVGKAKKSRAKRIRRALRSPRR
jgi:hypothetical protein